MLVKQILQFMMMILMCSPFPFSICICISAFIHIKLNQHGG